MTTKYFENGKNLKTINHRMDLRRLRHATELLMFL